MKIFDNLSNSKININEKKINIYSCGPTVYNYIHIGNARPLIITDIMNRFLKYQNFEINYVMNITDIDDKIIDFAIQNNLTEDNVANKFSEAFIDDLKKLNVESPNLLIPISNKMKTIINFIKKLISVNAAYEVDGDVYFDVSQFENEYGKISHQNIFALKDGVRIENNNKKRNHLDFTLWKKTKIGKCFESEWSSGRPGWHTECVALIDEIFDDTISIHVGGLDLKFPHHENERIQFLAKESKELSNTWMHIGHIKMNNQKMSKSIGNIITVKDFLQNHSHNVLRYILISSKYSQPINVTDDLIMQSEKWNDKLFNLIRKINWMNAVDILHVDLQEEKYLQEALQFLDNDLNTSDVITIIDKIVKNLNQKIKNNKIDNSYEELLVLIKILGFNFKLPTVSLEEKEKLKKWQSFLKQGNYLEADKLRQDLSHII